MEKLFSAKSIAAIVALSVGVAAFAACGGASPEDVEIEVSLQNKKLSPETLQVGQDDNVTLRIQSDAPGSVHLHGYDIGAEVVPGAIAEFVFIADATGRYRMTFHPVTTTSAGGSGHHGGSSEGSGEHHGSSGSSSSPSGSTETGMAHAPAASTSHGPIESEVPLSISIVAKPDAVGGVNVQIKTEGWRWAPEDVNGENSPGAGHAHIYVGDEKINRVYGPFYYLDGLEAGTHPIRVILNSNGHNDLTYNGKPVEASTTVKIEASGHGYTGHHDMEYADAVSSMAVELAIDPDPLGGYNLQVVPSGFEFTPQDPEAGHLDGQGFAYVSIDEERRARLYTPWFKLPGLDPGTHEISVSLVNNLGRSYTWEGNVVQSSVTVETATKASSSGPGHHDSGEGTVSTRAGHDGSQKEGAGDGKMSTGSEDEYDIGYLEVQPR